MLIINSTSYSREDFEAIETDHFEITLPNGWQQIQHTEYVDFFSDCQGFNYQCVFMANTFGVKLVISHQTCFLRCQSLDRLASSFAESLSEEPFELERETTLKREINQTDAIQQLYSNGSAAIMDVLILKDPNELIVIRIFSSDSGIRELSDPIEQIIDSIRFVNTS